MKERSNELAIRPFSILSLCSGIGGLELGVRQATANAARVVCFCEGEVYCASVLRARMEDGSLEQAPIWSDVKSFDASPWRGKVDCITAGYPCQPFSAAGRRKGEEDPRHLWPHIARHVDTIKPSIVFCENVPGHLTLGFEQVCKDLSGLGYIVEAGIFSAQEVGAPHRRERLFFLAYTNNNIWWQQCTERQSMVRANDRLHPERQQSIGRSAVGGEDVAHANSSRCDKGERQTSGSVWDQTRGPQLERLGGDVADAISVRKLQPHRGVLEIGGRIGDRSQQMAHADRDGRKASRTLRISKKDTGLESRRSCDSATKDGSAQRRLGQPIDGSSNSLDMHKWGDGWEDGVARVTHDQLHRIDRLRALGNAVVPDTAALAWKTLWRQAFE